MHCKKLDAIFKSTEVNSVQEMFCPLLFGIASGTWFICKLVLWQHFRISEAFIIKITFYSYELGQCKIINA